MNIRKLISLCLVGVLGTQGVSAQELGEFTIDAQLRSRAEYDNGTITPRTEGQMPVAFVNERARLGLGYQRKNLELKISAQHTGTWGQDDIKDRNGRVAMNEAWAKLTFWDGFFAQVGRQQLSYDDERLMGTSDWNVAGNWHDALRVGYENETDKVHMIFAHNQTKENNRGNFYDGTMPYKHMQTAWYHHQWQTAAPIGVSLLFMNVGREAGSNVRGKTRYMQTFGTDLTFLPDPWDFHAAFYYQTGKTTIDQTVGALMASAKVGYKLNEQWKFKVGYDFLSGEDYETANGNIVVKDDATKSHAFNPLYGTHHSFYGAMDYFYASPFGNGLAPGLQDIQAGADFKPCDKWHISLDYHYFLTASDVIVTDSKSLGHEIDCKVTAQLMPDVSISAGYSVMLSQKAMDFVKGGSHKSWQDWAWVSLNITPRLFKTK